MSGMSVAQKKAGAAKSRSQRGTRGANETAHCHTQSGMKTEAISSSTCMTVPSPGSFPVRSLQG